VLSFETAGDKEYHCRVRVYYDSHQKDLADYILTSGREQLHCEIGNDSLGGYMDFSGKGGTRYRLSHPRDRDNRQPASSMERYPDQGIRIQYFPHRQAMIAPGESYPYTLAIKNLGSTESTILLSAALPDRWEIEYPEGKEISLPAGKQKLIQIIVRCPADTKSSTEMISLLAIVNGRQRPIVEQAFTILTPLVKAGDDLSDLSEWEIHEATNYSQLSREVTVNLDQAGFLYVDTEGITGGYTLFASDGYTDQIRIISDTGHKGQYTCDLKKMTGWQGTHRFKFILYNWGETEPPVLNRFELGRLQPSTE